MTGDRLMHEPGDRSDRKPPPHVVRLSGVPEARGLLRARGHTKQAGFTAERIPQWLFRHRPILMDDGGSHDQHRRKLSRFFAPRILREKHGQFIQHTAAQRVGDALGAGECRLDELALLFAVEVTSRIVGLTQSRVDKLASRLTNFFRQPPVDHTRQDHGRTTRQWIRAARKALFPIVSLYWADVRPAIRARKRSPEDDIISHLIDSGYSRGEILMECLTYGTAGMVTTREFISVAAWHLLRDEHLREKFLAGDPDQRHAILNEIIRLEPPVGHLYRRVTGGGTRTAGGCPFAAGTLVDIDVRSANLDEQVFGDDADQLVPNRGIPAAEQPGLSFGDGAHRCPGSPLAILETDALLLELLARRPVIEQGPSVQWDTLVEGYQLRGFVLRFPAAGE